MALPHISNSQAGVNKWEPLYKNLFEVYFTIPAKLQAEFGKDVAILTEQVQSIDALDPLEKTPEMKEQTFMGTSRSYVGAKLDNTYMEPKVKFALNLRGDNAQTDNFLYKLFVAWNKLNYNIATGERDIKPNYCADWLKLKIGNKAGDVYKAIMCKDVMLKELSHPFASMDYSGDDLLELEVTFRTDWWDDVDA